MNFSVFKTTTVYIVSIFRKDRNLIKLILIRIDMFICRWDILRIRERMGLEYL